MLATSALVTQLQTTLGTSWVVSESASASEVNATTLDVILGPVRVLGEYSDEYTFEFILRPGDNFLESEARTLVTQLDTVLRDLAETAIGGLQIIAVTSGYLSRYAPEATKENPQYRGSYIYEVEGSLVL